MFQQFSAKSAWNAQFNWSADFLIFFSKVIFLLPPVWIFIIIIVVFIAIRCSEFIIPLDPEKVPGGVDDEYSFL